MTDPANLSLDDLLAAALAPGACELLPPLVYVTPHGWAVLRLKASVEGKTWPAHLGRSLR